MRARLTLLNLSVHLNRSPLKASTATSSSRMALFLFITAATDANDIHSGIRAIRKPPGSTLSFGATGVRLVSGVWSNVGNPLTRRSASGVDWTRFLRLTPTTDEPLGCTRCWTAPTECVHPFEPSCVCVCEFVIPHEETRSNLQGADT